MNAIIHPGSDGVRLAQLLLQEFIQNSTILNNHVPADLFGRYNSHKDVYENLFISCMTSRDIWNLPSFIKKWRSHTKRIIVGGLAARQLSDSALNHIDLIVVGNVFSENCQNVLMKESGKIYLSREKLPKIAVALPRGTKLNYFILKKLECQNQCKYCCGPVGSDSLTDDDVIDLAKKINKPINIFSPDGSISSYLYLELLKNKIKPINTNFTPKNAIDLIRRGMTVTIRVGLEGFSRKTRKELEREISDEDLSVLVNRPAVHFNLIAGVPGESFCDYMELYDQLASAKCGHTLTITPLEWSPFWRYGNNSAPDKTWEYIERFNAMLKNIKCWSRKTRSIEAHREIERMNGSCPFAD